MNNIHRIEGYHHKLSSIGQSAPNSPQESQKAAKVDKKEDKVQISNMALYMSKIASLPEIRAEKVEAIQEALAEGSYDVDGKLPAALVRLLEEENLV